MNYNEKIMQCISSLRGIDVNSLRNEEIYANEFKFYIILSLFILITILTVIVFFWNRTSIYEWDDRGVVYGFISIIGFVASVFTLIFLFNNLDDISNKNKSAYDSMSRSIEYEQCQKIDKLK